jgi:hypothetical protein
MALKIKKYYLIPEVRYKILLQKDCVVQPNNQTGGEEDKDKSQKQVSNSFEDNKGESDQTEGQTSSETIITPTENKEIGSESEKNLVQPYALAEFTKSDKNKLIKKQKSNDKISPPPGIPVKNKKRKRISWISL